MLKAKMRFETPNGCKYLPQLFKHFAHKTEVEYSESEGHCTLPTGPAYLTADGGGLTATVEGADDAGVERAKHIIADHLRRFAFRAAPAEFNWSTVVPQV